MIAPGSFKRSAMLAAALLVGAAGGCGSQDDPASAILPGAGTRPPPDAGPPVLEVDSTRADLGPLEPESSAVGTFELRNVSQRPIELVLGAPSCNCLDVQLEPTGPLAPGASARLRLELNTRNRTIGGPITGSVTVGVAPRSTEAYTFETVGVVEGLAQTRDYVVRPRHLESGEMPPLHFSLLTGRKDTPVTVLGVNVAARYTDDEALSAPDMGASQIVPLRARFEQLSASPLEVMSGYECFQHRFSLPVEAEGLNRPATGDFIIDYQIGERRATAKVPLLVIAPRT